jgi:hypothetical protein
MNDSNKATERYHEWCRTTWAELVGPEDENEDEEDED